jgi:hypothetical protein
MEFHLEKEWVAFYMAFTLAMAIGVYLLVSGLLNMVLVGIFHAIPSCQGTVCGLQLAFYEFIIGICMMVATLMITLSWALPYLGQEYDSGSEIGY